MTEKELHALLDEADALLRVARSAMEKLGLRGRGSDLNLSHEVRMFALDFSPEEREGPGALQVNGTGRLQQWLREARKAHALLKKPNGGRDEARVH